ncbi:hypothetical protein CGI50_23895 [Vibrio parahaemolyticus]|nr:hypothetical protein CGI50_23895 [Vibrio parahaemolyticus]
MKIVYEIDVTKEQHEAIESLRNQAFPDHQANRSYYKQLPHMRAAQEAVEKHCHVCLMLTPTIDITCSAEVGKNCT